MIALSSISVSAQKLSGTWISDSVNCIFCNDTLNTKNNYIGEFYYEPFSLTIKKNKAFLEKKRYIYGYGLYNDYKLKINSSKLILKNGININSMTLNNNIPGEIYFDRKKCYSYKIISDTLIKFTEYTDYDKCINEFYLHKAPEKTFLSFSEINKKYNEKLDQVFSNKIILSKKNNPAKKRYLNPAGKLEINTEYKNECRYINHMKYTIDAISAEKSDTLIYVHTIKIENSYSDCKGFYGTKTKTNSSYRLGDTLSRINKKTISFIYYYRPTEYKLHNFFKTIGWLSFASAVFAAPIVSFNYSNFKFNKKVYLNTFKTSLATMTISFTVSFLTNGTQYLIGDRYGEKGWYINQ